MHWRDAARVKLVCSWVVSWGPICSCAPTPSCRTWSIGWRSWASSCVGSVARSVPTDCNISALLTGFTVNSNFLVGKAACLNDSAFSNLGTTWCRNARRRKKAERTGKAYENAEFWHRKSSSFKQNISPLFNNVWPSTALFLMSWWLLLLGWCWGAGPRSRQQCPARAALCPAPTDPLLEVEAVDFWVWQKYTFNHNSDVLQGAQLLTYCFVETCSSQSYQGWEGGTGRTALSEKPSPFGSILLARGKCLQGRSATVLPDHPSQA